jgi:hypothetical protein
MSDHFIFILNISALYNFIYIYYIYDTFHNESFSVVVTIYLRTLQLHPCKSCIHMHMMEDEVERN